MGGSIQRRRGGGGVYLASLVAAVLVVAVARPAAHDIPLSVLVQVLARPSGDRLQMLVRVPLVSMRDVTFPSADGALLDVERAAGLLPDLARTWLAPNLLVFEDGRALDMPVVVAARVSLPSDRSFSRFDDAFAHLAAPALAPGTTLPITSALLDVRLEYHIQSDRARFDIDPRVARLGVRVMTTFQFLAADGSERAFQFTGDPGRVHLDPSWSQAAMTFVRLGFAHILGGIDHLLFLVCLVLPLRRFRQLVVVVTAFTAAHSVTLVCAAFGYVPDAIWFPPLVETLTAASIVYMAIENIVMAASAGDSAVVASVLHRRWLVAGAFGLVHGFGFSFALQETLQFAGAHLVTSLLAFNVGIEIGQLLVLALLVPVLQWSFQKLMTPKIGVILASAIVAHTAWHWMTTRGAVLGDYGWWPPEAASLAFLLRLLMVVVAIVAMVWLVRSRRGRR
jgi:hypothetical protein